MASNNKPATVAVLDDYQNAALRLADWSVLDGRAALTVFNDHLADTDAVVALDSQGDMLKTLSHLDRFNPETDDRLIIVNPADYEWPLRLNIFDIPRERLARMSPGLRLQWAASLQEELA